MRIRTPGAVVAALLTAAPLTAGGTPENAFLIVDPANAESMYVANHYLAMRDVPRVNALYMAPGAANYAALAAANVKGFLGALENKDIGEHIDYVVIPPGGSFYVPGGGYVQDGCSPVTRFATPFGYMLARQTSTLLAGGLNSLYANEFWGNSWNPRAFDSSQGWLNGVASGDPSAKRYFIGALLGYTGFGGNTTAEIVALIDRSVAVDGTLPAGTFYFMHTTDPARSGPRHGDYPNAVSQLALLGGSGSLLFANLPLTHHDALGIMTGFAADDIDNADLSLLPGSFADHLTSYAATFDDSSQTKMSRWISKGASGTCGEIEEPCNYAEKFPSARLHVEYCAGLSLGEAWFRSLEAVPFQGLFTGDPLTRPWARFPTVSVSAPGGAVSGTLALTPVVAATAAGAAIASVELLVDGVLWDTRAAGESFALDTTALAEGWHELRVLATDDAAVRNVGRWVGGLEVDNAAPALTLTCSLSSGDLATDFPLSVAATGGAVAELRVLHNGRVVAAAASAAALLSVHGQNLGAGPVRLQAEARMSDGSLARSAPLDLTIAYAPGTPAASAPLAYSYSKRVLREQAFVVELPASFGDALPSATFTLLVPPAQATLLATPAGPYRVFQPSAGANGVDSLTFQVATPGGSSTVATVELDYFAEAAALPYGCTNPPGSLTVLSGAPRIGTFVTLGVDNPNGTQPVGAIPFLFFSLAPDSNYPCGLPLPGWGMGARGSSGELLFAGGPPNYQGRAVGSRWTGAGHPAPIPIFIPNSSSLVGLSVFTQGMLVAAPSASGNHFGLTTGLELRIGS